LLVDGQQSSAAAFSYGLRDFGSVASAAVEDDGNLGHRFQILSSCDEMS